MRKFLTILAVTAALIAVDCNRAAAQFSDNQMWETWVQYAPVVVDLGLGFTGVKCEDGFVDRVMAAGLGYVSEVIIVDLLLKNVVKELRPDKSSYNSFPSGHTTTAFLGAELVRHEYGWGWGLGAYAVATSVGVARCCHNRHWPVDVMGGAVIGILCANIGYWTLEPVKSLFGIKTDRNIKVALVPSVEPRSGAMCATLAMTF